MPPEIGQAWKNPDKQMIVRTRAGLDVGQLKHTEDSNLMQMDSDWEGVIFRSRVMADVRLRCGAEFSAEVNGFLSTKEDENWHWDFGPVEDNELDISGYEFRVMAGYGVDIDSFGRISLLGGISGRWLQLDREFSSGSTSNTESDVFLWEVEARFELPFDPEVVDYPMAFEASVSYGELLSPEADVDGFGTIKGDGGYLVRFRAGLNTELAEGVGLYLGGFFETLKIEGGVDGAGEWPDSESTAAGGEISLTLKF